MKAIRRRLKINESNQILLTDLPFSVGEEIEVLILGIELNEENIDDLRSLFRKTQVLPQIERISESDIEAEIQAYRDNQ